MDSEQEWPQQVEEKFLQQEEQKEEKYCQHRPHICGLFFSLIETYGVFMIFSESLKKNQDFQRVYRAADSRANRYLVLYRLENGLSKNRIGISVSKKVGNSVVRHHMCRLIRESYRLNEKSLKPGYDLVVVVRPLAKSRSYREIESALLHLMKLQNLVQELSSENKDEKNLNRND